MHPANQSLGGLSNDTRAPPRNKMGFGMSLPHPQRQRKYYGASGTTQHPAYYYGGDSSQITPPNIVTAAPPGGYVQWYDRAVDPSQSVVSKTPLYQAIYPSANPIGLVPFVPPPLSGKMNTALHQLPEKVLDGGSRARADTETTGKTVEAGKKADSAIRYASYPQQRVQVQNSKSSGRNSSDKEEETGKEGSDASLEEFGSNGDSNSPERLSVEPATLDSKEARCNSLTSVNEHHQQNHHHHQHSERQSTERWAHPPHPLGDPAHNPRYGAKTWQHRQEVQLQERVQNQLAVQRPHIDDPPSVSTEAPYKHPPLHHETPEMQISERSADCVTRSDSVHRLDTLERKKGTQGDGHQLATDAKTRRKLLRSRAAAATVARNMAQYAAATGHSRQLPPNIPPHYTQPVPPIPSQTLPTTQYPPPVPQAPPSVVPYCPSSVIPPAPNVPQQFVKTTTSPSLASVPTPNIHPAPPLPTPSGPGPVQPILPAPSAPPADNHLGATQSCPTVSHTADSGQPAPPLVPPPTGPITSSFGHKPLQGGTCSKVAEPVHIQSSRLGLGEGNDNVGEVEEEGVDIGDADGERKVKEGQQRLPIEEEKELQGLAKTLLGEENYIAVQELMLQQHTTFVQQLGDLHRSHSVQQEIASSKKSQGKHPSTAPAPEQVASAEPSEQSAGTVSDQMELPDENPTASSDVTHDEVSEHISNPRHTPAPRLPNQPPIPTWNPSSSSVFTPLQTPRPRQAISRVLTNKHASAVTPSAQKSRDIEAQRSGSMEPKKSLTNPAPTRQHLQPDGSIPMPSQQRNDDPRRKNNNMNAERGLYRKGAHVSGIILGLPPPPDPILAGQWRPAPGEQWWKNPNLCPDTEGKEKKSKKLDRSEKTRKDKSEKKSSSKSKDSKGSREKMHKHEGASGNHSGKGNREHGGANWSEGIEAGSGESKGSREGHKERNRDGKSSWERFDKRQRCYSAQSQMGLEKRPFESLDSGAALARSDEAAQRRKRTKVITPKPMGATEQSALDILLSIKQRAQSK